MSSSSTMRCVGCRELFGMKRDAVYTSAMPVADFSKTEDADVELDEGYNGRRPKEPRAKNIAARTIPSQVGRGGGDKVGLCGRKRQRYQTGTLRVRRRAAGVSAENTAHHQQISCLGRVLRERHYDLSEFLISSRAPFFFFALFFSSLSLLPLRFYLPCTSL